MATSLRLPADLQAELKRLAKAHERSEHSEMIFALRQYVEQHKERKSMKKHPFEIAFPNGANVEIEDEQGHPHDGVIATHLADELWRPYAVRVRLDEGGSQDVDYGYLDPENPANSIVRIKQ